MIIKSVKDKINKYNFLYACWRVRKKHNCLNSFRLKILRTCLKDLDKISIPTSEKEKELMTKILGIYDETLQELSKDVKRFKEYVEIEE